MGPTDGALVHRVRQGDQEAFDQLVRRHLKAAHAVARRHLNDPSEADDVCQEAFIKALEAIDGCRDPERFRAWLLKIVTNAAHNRREYNRVRDAVPLEAAAAVPSGSDPYLDAERSGLRSALTEAMGGLTELQRRVLVLHDMEGWKHHEIGQKLGISAGSSRVHLHVARRAMRKRLSGRLAMEAIR